QSLVIYNGNDPELRDETNILHKCKEQLIDIALPDGIVYSKKSILKNEKIDYWHNFYFQQDCGHFSSYIRLLLKDAKKV
ncbi:37689_t:CDS:1, partial [Gigaspora margarita]